MQQQTAAAMQRPSLQRPSLQRPSPERPDSDGAGRLDQLFFTSMRTLDVYPTVSDDETTTDQTSLLRKRVNGSLEDAVANMPSTSSKQLAPVPSLQNLVEQSAEDLGSSSMLPDDLFALSLSGKAPMIGKNTSSQKLGDVRGNQSMGKKNMSTDSLSAIAALTSKGGRKLRKLGKKSLSIANLSLNKIPAGSNGKPSLTRSSSSKGLNSNASFGNMNSNFKVKDLGLNRLLKGKSDKTEPLADTKSSKGNRVVPEPFEIAVIQKPQNSSSNDLESMPIRRPGQDQLSRSSHVPRFSINEQPKRPVRDSLSSSAHNPLTRRRSSSRRREPTSPRRRRSSRTSTRLRERTSRSESERLLATTSSKRESNGSSRPRPRPRKARSMRIDAPSSPHEREDLTLRKEGSCPNLTRRTSKESRRDSLRANLRAELSVEDKNSGSRRQRPDSTRRNSTGSAHSRRSVARRRARVPPNRRSSESEESYHSEKS